jgi:hypothetical protein
MTIGGADADRAGTRPYLRRRPSGSVLLFLGLHTYGLLGGEKKKEGAVKRWFKPVNGLGDAGNSILYDGLQGSPLFETSESFFHKLESALRSNAGESRALHASPLQIRERPMALSGTHDVIRRFNRDTKWLATEVLAAMATNLM